MKVVCSLCSNERNGFCTVKKQSGSPTKIKLNKRRNCDFFKEDASKVLQKFRSKEAHDKNNERVQQKNLAVAKALEEWKQTVKRVKGKSGSSNED